MTDTPEKERPTIRLKVSDSCWERARKILQCAGLCDGVGLAERMAEALAAYRDMDREAGRFEVDNSVCPHCGSKSDPWFSRTTPMAYVCADCGKDVDESR